MGMRISVFCLETWAHTSSRIFCRTGALLRGIPPPCVERKHDSHVNQI